VIARGGLAAVAATVVVGTGVVLPGTASAVTTRAIQATDNQLTFQKYWTPNALQAQLGDTIQWRLTEPGNPLAAQHDLWVIAPGGTPADAVQLGTTASTPVVDDVLSQTGVYTFYCSIHGGLAPGGMNGTITVGTDDPGPSPDPGQPWALPPTGDQAGAGPVGPPPLHNSSATPTEFESGDLLRPRIVSAHVRPVAGGVYVDLRASRRGTVLIRVLRGWRPVATRTLRVTGGINTLHLVDARKVKPGRYRVQVRLTDVHRLRSYPRSSVVTITR